MKNEMNILNIAFKARKLVFGFDACIDSAKCGKAKLITVCADISPKTLKEVHFRIDPLNIPITQMNTTVADMEARFGKRIAVIAVCDEGFARVLNEKKTEL